MRVLLAVLVALVHIVVVSCHSSSGGWGFDRATDLEGVLAERPTGYLGGDVATSIAVNDTHAIWLFGDTLTGTYNESTGERFINDYCFPRNSIGLMNCGKPHCSPKIDDFTHYWREPCSSFFSFNGSDWIWVTSGIYLNSTGSVLLMGAEEESTTSSSSFGWQQVTNVAYRISNPLDPLALWNVTARSVPHSDASSTADWASAMYEEDGFVYWLGSLGTSGNILARVTVEQMDSLNFTAMEVWLKHGSGGKWGPFSRKHAKELWDFVIPETTIYKLANGTYVVPYIPFGGFHVYFLMSSALTGPWETSPAAYKIPGEIKNLSGVLAYAPKIHSSFSNSTTLLMTYMTNAPGDSKGSYSEIYVPQPVWITLNENARA